MSNKILLATHNKGKLAEFIELFKDTSFTFIDQSTFSFEPAVESGLTFIENALLKARHASFLSDLPVIADDSGLVVDKLKGMPGIYSARYAGEHSTDEENRRKLLHELSHTALTERQATFYCVLVYLRHWQDPAPIIAQGLWHGTIAEEEKGHYGFGYDSLFYLPEYGLTAAELAPQEKNRLSHRAQATAQLLELIRKR